VQINTPVTSRDGSASLRGQHRNEPLRMMVAPAYIAFDLLNCMLTKRQHIYNLRLDRQTFLPLPWGHRFPADHLRLNAGRGTCHGRDSYAYKTEEAKNDRYKGFSRPHPAFRANRTGSSACQTDGARIVHLDFPFCFCRWFPP
jgi:hypothetical protein